MRHRRDWAQEQEHAHASTEKDVVGPVAIRVTAAGDAMAFVRNGGVRVAEIDLA
jgi:hypothetical protein